MAREGKITKDELHSSTLIASNIKISDSNNYYKSNDVEGALNEIKIELDGQKTRGISIANSLLSKIKGGE